MPVLFRDSSKSTNLTDQLTQEFMNSISCTQYMASCLAIAINERYKTDEEKINKAQEIVEFTKKIGKAATEEYLSAMFASGAVKEFIDEKILSFAKWLGPNGAEKYFKAITKAKVPARREQTEIRHELLTSKEFFSAAKELNKSVAGEYFLAIATTGEVENLVNDRVFNFIADLNKRSPVAAAEYFRAIRVTGATDLLTKKELFTFVKSIENPETLFHYFATPTSYEDVRLLTDLRILARYDFINKLKSEIAAGYFCAIVSTKGVATLTDNQIVERAELLNNIGTRSAWEWFYTAGERGWHEKELAGGY